MKAELTYPIAEIFHSVQGEGLWAGTPMMFVRLAGCTVGRYISPSLAYEDAGKNLTKSDFKLFDTAKHSICTTFDNQRFLCDTDYHATQAHTVEEISAQLQGEFHVCITGGEPLMHTLNPLVHTFNRLGVQVHIETSGTLPYPEGFRGSHDVAPVWITVCPKKGFLEDWYTQADEFKVLVGPGFDEEAFKHFLPLTEGVEVFLQPINLVSRVDQENTQRCLELLKKYPQCRLSPQLHKFLMVR